MRRLASRRVLLELGTLHNRDWKGRQREQEVSSSGDVLGAVEEQLCFQFAGLVEQLIRIVKASGAVAPASLRCFLRPRRDTIAGRVRSGTSGEELRQPQEASRAAITERAWRAPVRAVVLELSDGRTCDGSIGCQQRAHFVRRGWHPGRDDIP